MKKYLTIIVLVCLLLSLFTACTNSTENANEETTEISVSETEREIAMTESEAVDYIKSYSAEELSLSQEDYENCNFMINYDGKEIEGERYIEIIAAYKESHTNEDGSESYTFDTKGSYYIRYDGKRVLKKDIDGETVQYVDMEVKEIS